MRAKAYLERIGYRGRIRPSTDVLRRLHRKHLLSIPFENLDIHLGRPIILNKNSFYDKIIKHHRGGLCYELNGLFATLLDEFGFKVSMLSARVPMKSGGVSPEFDHMTLVVQLKHPWLVDVGFGDSFAEPKRLDRSGPQVDHGRQYRFTRRNGAILLSRRPEKKARMGASIPVYLATTKAERFHSKMPLATDLSKVAFQERPHLHTAHFQRENNAY